ncbi:MAG: 6-pyruvoyl trahydropterin synthase family protein [Chloroflexota bacterium]
MFEVGVVSQFEAAHSLPSGFGPASRKHGHTYRVEVSVQGARLQPGGVLMDITILQEALRAALDPLDYQDLDELDEFSHASSTAEGVAVYLFQFISPRLRGAEVDSLKVMVWESPGAFASFDGPLNQGPE